MKYSYIWPNQTIVSDQSELTILLCQPMNSLLLKWRQPCHGTAAFNYNHPIYMILARRELCADALIQHEILWGSRSTKNCQLAERRGKLLKSFMQQFCKENQLKFYNPQVLNSFVKMCNNLFSSACMIHCSAEKNY